MKRFLAVTLVFSMIFLSIFVFASCNKGGKDNETSAKKTTTPPPSTTASPVTSDPGTTELVFTDVNEKVYISTDALNIRKAPGLTGEIKVQLKRGAELTRVGYNENWSKVKIDGDDTVYYASTPYLATEKPAETSAPVEVVFTDVQSITRYTAWNNQTSGTVNIRKVADMSGTATVIPIGTAVVVTGVAYEDDTQTDGWSRITYDSETYYIRNSCLSDTNPATPTT